MTAEMQARELLDQGRSIDAIKAMKDECGGLLNAKSYIEDLIHKEYPHKFKINIPYRGHC